MLWTKITIKTTTKDADMVSAILMDHEICDVQIENNVQLTDEELNQMYADFVKELPPDDGSCSVSFFMESKEDGTDREETETFLASVKQDLDEAVELFGIAPCEIVSENLNSEDWENNWKEFFKPFTVDRILIAPTWEEIPENPSEVISVDRIDTFVSQEDAAKADPEKREGPEQTEITPDIIIRIDPGMAFGTGTHETTRLCLRALQTCLHPGDRLLDLGCGSGILGIAGIRLGAESVTSVDIDEQAVAVAKENFTINEIPEEKTCFYTGNAAGDEALAETILEGGVFDVLTVNILADVIIVMMPYLDRYLKEGGVLITSGILNTREEAVKEAAAQNPNLNLKEATYDGEWVSLVFQKR